MQEYQNFEKHACHHTFAMETCNCLGQDMSFQNVTRYRLGKVVKFGGIFFDIKNVIKRLKVSTGTFDLESSRCQIHFPVS